MARFECKRQTLRIVEFLLAIPWPSGSGKGIGMMRTFAFHTMLISSMQKYNGVCHLFATRLQRLYREDLQQPIRVCV